MNRMLVVVFDNETAAVAGTRALRQLDAEAGISLYAMGVIAKDAHGKISLKQATGQEPVGTSVGFGVGALIGLLGGPAGAAVGAVTGTLVGALRDYWVAGVGLDFVEEAETFLKPGKVAVIAEIDEDWITPVDSRMEAVGGVVFRRERSEVADARFDRDIAAFKSEITDLQSEFEQASGDAKLKLKTKVAAARHRLDEAVKRAKHRVEALDHEAKDKLTALEHQLSKAKGDVKTKLDHRVKAMRSAYPGRSAKLKQAWELTKEAVAG